MFISLLSPFVILKAKRNGPNVNFVYGIYSNMNRPLKKGDLALTLPIGSNTSHSDHLYIRLMPLDSNLAYLIGTPLIKSDILEYFDVLDDKAELDKALKTLWLQGFNRVKTKQELMISALEAYEKTSYVLDNALRNELKTVENKINEAIEKGEFHITLYDTFLSSSTKSTLEKLGYKVERISDNTTLIVWEFASK